MDDNHLLFKEQTGLADLVLQVREQYELAQLRVRETRAQYESARRAKERAEENLATVTEQMERLISFAERLGFSGEDIEKFCEHEMKLRAEKAANSAIGVSGKKLSNRDLMIFVAELLEREGNPLTISQIMDSIKAADIFLPGQTPEKNLTAYLSRSPLIKSVKRGWYFYEPTLLAAARGELTGLDRTEGSGSEREGFYE